MAQRVCCLEIEAGCLETGTYQHHYNCQTEKKVSLEFTADPFRADEITPAAELRKSQSGPGAPYVIKKKKKELVISERHQKCPLIEGSSLHSRRREGEIDSFAISNRDLAIATLSSLWFYSLVGRGAMLDPS